MAFAVPAEDCGGVAFELVAVLVAVFDGAFQIPQAELAGVFNVGRAAVATYVSILKRAR